MFMCWRGSLAFGSALATPRPGVSVPAVHHERGELESCCDSLRDCERGGCSACRRMLVTVTATGRIYIWAHILSQNWDVFAPGFRTLTANEIYVESETEFDLPEGGAGNPCTPSGDDEDDGGINGVTVRGPARTYGRGAPSILT